MAVNKVVIRTGTGENVLIDVTGDTVTQEAVFEGATFHGADGEAKTGTFTIAEEMSVQDGLISAIKTALNGKASGGGGTQIDTGLVVTSMNANNKILTADLYGETVPCFRYAWYNESVYPTLTAKTNVVTLSGYAFANTFASFADGFFDSLLYAGEYALGLSKTTNATFSLPVFTGYTSSEKKAAAGSLFRSNVAVMQSYILPRVEIIGNFWWYQKTFNGGIVQLGSVGHPVLKIEQRPFGSASGSATITVYTKGELLDTISTAITNQAGSGLTFVFKAAEATTYNGTSYAADDTMSEVTT